MSAIWGRISWKDSIQVDTSEKMELPYKSRCKIERYRCWSDEVSLFGCGIQHITREAALEVIPIFDSENQLLFNADCIIDNRDEIIEELEACKALKIPSDVLLSTSEWKKLKDLPDGSLMYLSYLVWGIDCLKHFRGLFSMSVYDKKSKVLYVAADQCSNRCLYYTQNENEVVFSTLLDSIRGLGYNNQNENYMKDYLCAGGLVPNLVADESPVEAVFKVTPGSYVEITQAGTSIHKYWTLFDRDNNLFKQKKINSARPEHVFAKAKKLKTAEDFSGLFNEIYTQAVNDAMRVNGNVGISMSSGYDSASVGAIASDLLATKKEKLYAYTYVPYEMPKSDVPIYILDETKYVNEIIEMHPNIIPHFLNNNGKNAVESIEAFIELMEIPYKAFINLPNLCEVYDNAVKDGCKVVLTGQYGNTTVSQGYIVPVLFDLFYRKKYITFFRYLSNYCKHMKIRRKEEFPLFIDLCHQHVGFYKKDKRVNDIANPFLLSGITEGYSFDQRLGYNQLSYTEGIVYESLYREKVLYEEAIMSYIGEADTKLSLKYGIVLRDATRDSRILSFCYSVPYEYFAYNGMPRYFVYSTMQNRLPASILETWHRYGVQNADWLDRISRDFDRVLPIIKAGVGELRKCDYVDSTKLEEYIDNLVLPLSDEENDKMIYLCILYIYSRYHFVYFQ